MATCIHGQRLVTASNLLTLVRPVCTLPFIMLCSQIQPHVGIRSRVGATLLFAVIIGSDIADGWLARRLQQSSALGRTLDHLSDVLFVLTTLVFFGSLGLVPWWLPTAIAWAFTLYVIDSWWRTTGHAQRSLLGSRMGHLGGILNYSTVGVVTGNLCLDGSMPPAVILHGWFFAVAVWATLSGLERFILLICALSPRSPAMLRVRIPHQSSHSEP